MSDYPNTASPRRRVARGRGATSGILLIILGAWGALIPFIGPYFNFSYTPDTPWTWTAARGWLEVLPGAAVFLGGVLLLISASRAMTQFGAWLAVAGGAWFVVGLPLRDAWNIGSPGIPAGTSTGRQTLEALAMFYLLGAVILFLAATALGRLSVVSPRDIRAAERRQELAEQEIAAREAAAREASRGRFPAETDETADEDAVTREQELSTSSRDSRYPADAGTDTRTAHMPNAETRDMQSAGAEPAGQHAAPTGADSEQTAHTSAGQYDQNTGSYGQNTWSYGHNAAPSDQNAAPYDQNATPNRPR